MTNPHEIARGLTEAQRRAVLFCREGERGAYWLAGSNSTVFRALWVKGVASYHSRPSRLTPLGMQVRAALTEPTP